jgi:hypothetical protein
MVTHAAAPSAVSPTIRSEKWLATLTLAMLLCCVFDVGRAMYYRMLLNYAVSNAARVLTRTPLDPTELVRRLSGVKDVYATLVRIERAPRALMVTARYDVPLVSPPLWPIFGRGQVSLEAVGVAPLSAPAAREPQSLSFGSLRPQRLRENQDTTTATASARPATQSTTTAPSPPRSSVFKH